jgi:UbiD family decarboxylase
VISAAPLNFTNRKEQNMPYQDLRDWIQQVERFGELKTVHGADWNLEIGALTEVAARGETSDTILFDNIKDYPAGHRVLVGMSSSLKRQCLITNLPLDYDRMQFVDA